MPREKEAYRDNLERIIERFPCKEILTYKDVCDCLKKDHKTVKKLFQKPKCGGIPIVILARELS